MLLFWKNIQEKKKILIWSKEKNNFFLIFRSILEGKNKHASITKFNPTSNEKKFSSIYFFFTVWKS
jgi:hypothetical protein